MPKKIDDLTPIQPPPASRFARNKPKEDIEEKPKEPDNVSAGVIERVTDYAFNPSREKIREMTVVDRAQVRLLPQLDLIGEAWKELIEVMVYRQDSTEYERVFKQKRPIPFDPIDYFIYRFAQWQKSRDGINLKSAVDLSLAEMETKGDEGTNIGDDLAKWG